MHGGNGLLVCASWGFPDECEEVNGVFGLAHRSWGSRSRALGTISGCGVCSPDTVTGAFASRAVSGEDPTVHGH